MFPRGHSSEKLRHNKSVIRISGFKCRTKSQDIINGLRSFGEIISCKIHRGFEAFLTFKNRSSVERMLQYPYNITLNGRILKITRAQCRFVNSLVKPRFSIPELHKTVASQLDYVLRTVLLTKQQHSECTQVVAMLENIVGSYGRVVPFGSFSNGLALKKCDIDVTLVDCPPETFDVVSRVLLKCKQAKRVHSSKGRRYPLIRFYFRLFPSRRVELSFHNRMGIFNTMMFSLYVGYSSAFRDASAVIRQWFVKRQSEGVYINSYTINLMILICLTNKEYNLSAFPSPADLIEMADERVLVDDWVCGIPTLNKLFSLVGPSPLSALDIVFNFFYFWSHQDYSRIFLSSTGSTVPRDPSTTSPLWIQDPYIETFNVSHMMDEDSVYTMIDEINESYLTLLDNDFSSISPIFD